MYGTNVCDSCGRNIYLINKFIHELNKQNEDNIISDVSDINFDLPMIFDQLHLDMCCRATINCRLDITHEVLGYHPK